MWSLRLPQLCCCFCSVKFHAVEARCDGLSARRDSLCETHIMLSGTAFASSVTWLGRKGEDFLTTSACGWCRMSWRAMISNSWCAQIDVYWWERRSVALLRGMGNWPMTGWLVSDIWPTVSIASDDWLAFLVTLLEEAQWFRINTWGRALQSCVTRHFPISTGELAIPETWHIGFRVSDLLVADDYKGKDLRCKLSPSLHLYSYERT